MKSKEGSAPGARGSATAPLHCRRPRVRLALVGASEGASGRPGDLRSLRGAFVAASDGTEGTSTRECGEHFQRQNFNISEVSDDVMETVRRSENLEGTMGGGSEGGGRRREDMRDTRGAE